MAARREELQLKAAANREWLLELERRLECLEQALPPPPPPLQTPLPARGEARVIGCIVKMIDSIICSGHASGLNQFLHPSTHAEMCSQPPWCAHSCGGVTEAHWSHMLTVTFLYVMEQPLAPVQVAVHTARLGATCATRQPW